MFNEFSTTEMPAADRRTSQRFPIERDLRFRVYAKRGIPQTGSGTTVNISSSGVLFRTEDELAPGKRVELAISWPAQLSETCSLKLVARGRVVRAEGQHAAVAIQQYEFRTQGSQGLTL